VHFRQEIAGGAASSQPPTIEKPLREARSSAEAGAPSSFAFESCQFSGEKIALLSIPATNFHEQLYDLNYHHEHKLPCDKWDSESGARCLFVDVVEMGPQGAAASCAGREWLVLLQTG